MSIKKNLHALIQYFGYDIHKVTTFDEQMRKYDRPLPMLDLATELSVLKKQDFFFVQVGANNGKRYDPMYGLIYRHGLKGLLIEPLPDLFVELKANYASQVQLRFENAAIASQDGTVTIYRFKAEAPLEDWAHGLATLDREKLRIFADLWDAHHYLEEVRVPALTMSTLLAKHQISTVDLLQIDTEGYDLEVIKQTFQAQCYPDIIHFENAHLGNTGRCEARQVLAQNHYRFVDGTEDTLAIRNSENLKDN